MLIRVLFLILAALGIAATLGVVLARNLVRAALYLVGFFFIVACLYILLEAEFLAAVQVLVYIGAVAILVLFGIMLTRNIQGDETTRSSWPTRLVCGGAAAALLAVLIGAIYDETGSGLRPSWTTVRARPPAVENRVADSPTDAHQLPTAMVIGIEMMTRYLVAFELAGLLLTAAVVGAIALALNDPTHSAAEPAAPEDATSAPPAPPDPGVEQPTPALEIAGSSTPP